MQAVTTLLGQLAALAEARRDGELFDACGSWERRLRRTEAAARKAAIELGAQPDAAIEPLDDSKVGQAAHSVAHAFGSLGEWMDRRAGPRRG
jgi:hypothetical protein